MELENYFLFKVDICISTFRFRSLVFLFILHVGFNFNLIIYLTYSLVSKKNLPSLYIKRL